MAKDGHSCDKEHLNHGEGGGAGAEFCPVGAALLLIQQKWTLHIIRELIKGKRRFNELSHALGGINPRTLRERLRLLEAEELVEREVISEIPPWVEYSLTEKGRDLHGAVKCLTDWGTKWMKQG